MSSVLLLGVVLAAALLLIWVVDIFRPRPKTLSWGSCWFCERFIGDNVEVVRLAPRAYVPCCPKCADKQKAVVTRGR